MQEILEHFSQRIKDANLAHGYIIDQINEENAFNFFSELKSTLQVQEQDCYFITPSTASISVDQIRTVTERLSKTPIGPLHLVGISPADKMNAASCNALLKCLEEPFGSTCFILFTKNRRILMPTVRSRTQFLIYPSQQIDIYKDHDAYPLIYNIYQYNTALLSSNLEGISLYEALYAQSFEKIHALEGSALTYIHLSIQIISSILLHHSNQRLWMIYDTLIDLSKDFQSKHNLNDKTVLDRIALAFFQ